MSLDVYCPPRSEALMHVPVFWRPRQAGPGAGRRLSTMAIDDRNARDAARWAALIAAVAAHQDRIAFAALFAHFAPLVKTFMRRSGATDTSADELAQETLLAVWRKAALFNPETAGVSAWIFTIARNLRIDALRRGRRSHDNETYAIDLEFHIDDSPGPEARTAASEKETRVRAAMAVLSADQSRVVELSFYEEQAHADIARILQIPLGTVKSRLRLAMNRLRDALGDFS